MGERDDARGQIEQTRDRMTTIVEELARRATPGYVGEQIKEATVKKTKEIRERATASPYALPLLGGAIGAIVGSWFARQRDDDMRIERTRFDYRGVDEVTGYGDGADVDEGGGMKEKARELKDGVMDKLSGVGERGSEAIEDVRLRAMEIGDSARGWFSRALDEQPLLIGAGVAILGALVAVMAPVPEREKRIVEPARRKASEGIQKLGEKIEETLEGADAGGKAASSGDGVDLGEIDEVEIDIASIDEGDGSSPTSIH